MPRANKAAEPQLAEAPVVETAEEPKSLELVPEFIPTRKVTKRSYDKVRDDVFNKHSEGMLEEMFAALRKRIRTGDPRALQLGAEMHKLVGMKGGVTVNQNVQQNNSNEARATAVAAQSKGFDDLVRRLDGREYQISTDADFIDSGV